LAALLEAKTVRACMHKQLRGCERQGTQQAAWQRACGEQASPAGLS
jgi:hypothetical protein